MMCGINVLMKTLHVSMQIVTGIFFGSLLTHIILVFIFLHVRRPVASQPWCHYRHTTSKKPTNHYVYRMASPTIRGIVSVDDALSLTGPSRLNYITELFVPGDRRAEFDGLDLESNPQQQPQGMNSVLSIRFYLPSFSLR